MKILSTLIMWAGLLVGFGLAFETWTFATAITHQILACAQLAACVVSAYVLARSLENLAARPKETRTESAPDVGAGTQGEPGGYGGMTLSEKIKADKQKQQEPG